jgi:hypothetical protein
MISGWLLQRFERHFNWLLGIFINQNKNGKPHLEGLAAFLSKQK